MLKNAGLIDGTGRPLQRGVSIVISGGRIRQIGPAAQVKAPRGANVVDLTGKTVMPGIMNLHGHLGLVEVKGIKQDRAYFTRDNIEAQLRNYASFGVTTMVDMGSDVDPQIVLRIRDEEREGRLNGMARVFTAGRGFTCPGGYPAVLPGNKGIPFEVSSADEARMHVDELAKMRVDLVKMWVDDELGRYPKISPQVYSAIIDEAHKRHLKAAAHLFYLADAKRLLEAGLDAMAHSVRDQGVDDDLIARLKRNNATAIPTLAREQSVFVWANHPAFLGDPFFERAVSPESLATLKSAAYVDRMRSNPDFSKYPGFFATASRNLKRLSDAGVRIGFGTDTGPPGRIQGFFEHWEMELMVKAGLTPMQAIEAASKNAAEYLGVSRDFGTLEKGKHADLLVLDKSPLDDIRNTRTIAAVYLGGEKIR